MRAPAALLLALLSTAVTAQEQNPPIDCSRATSTVELNACEDRELAAADKRLNEAYRAALLRIDQAASHDANLKREWRQAFQDAQRKWIAFRDADCKGPIAYEWYGGSGATLAVLGCLRGKTEARAKELREYLAR